METRRGFLKLFGSLIATTATERVLGNTITKSIAEPSSVDECCKEILWKAYFPLLKQNESENLCFYRCPTHKITVGYGTNVESNPDLLKNISLFKDHQELSPKEKTAFLKTMDKKEKEELGKFSISKESAQKLAKTYTLQAIQSIVQIFKEQNVSFFNFPLPMQVLALDIYYNVGKSGFLKYKRFKKALINKNYKKATKEAKVMAGKNINKERERRKKRLFTLTEIRIKNPHLSLEETKKLAQTSYQKETPKLTQILVGKMDRISEEAILTADFNLEKSKALAFRQPNQPKIQHV